MIRSPPVSLVQLGLASTVAFLVLRGSHSQPFVNQAPGCLARLAPWWPQLGTTFPV